MAPAPSATDAAQRSATARDTSWVFYYGLVILAMSLAAGYRDGNAADALLFVAVNFIFFVLPVLWVHRVRRSRRLERELA